MQCRSVPKSVTLNDLEQRNGHHFALFHRIQSRKSTLCLKKGPTFKLSVTLSNLNRFSKFLHYWKAYKIRYKTNTTLLTSP